MRLFDEDSYEGELPKSFRPRHALLDFDDLEGSGFSDFDPYVKYFDGDFDELANENYRSLVNPLDELEDLAPDGSSLEYTAPHKKRRK